MVFLPYPVAYFHPGAGLPGLQSRSFFYYLLLIHPLLGIFSVAGTLRDLILALSPDTFLRGLFSDLLLVVKDTPPGFFFF